MSAERKPYARCQRHLDVTEIVATSEPQNLIAKSSQDLTRVADLVKSEIFKNSLIIQDETTKLYNKLKSSQAVIILRIVPTL